MRKNFLALILLLLLTSGAKGTETWTIPVPNQDRPPFTYIGEKIFGSRMDVRDPEQVVRMVAAGRGDVGLLQYEVQFFMQHSKT